MCLSDGSNINVESKMTSQNKHDRSIERPKTRYPQIPF